MGEHIGGTGVLIIVSCICCMIRESPRRVLFWLGGEGGCVAWVRTECCVLQLDDIAVGLVLWVVQRG